jgi:alpha-mannosidase
MRQKFDAAWEDILLCQFHDVLPGSGIAMVSLTSAISSLEWP